MLCFTPMYTIDPITMDVFLTCVPLFASLCKALWGCSTGRAIGMRGTGQSALIHGWLLWMQLPMLWSAWKNQKRSSPGGTDVPEGERNGSLLEELQDLLGNLVILLLFRYIELTQQVLGLLCFHIQTSASIPELSKSKIKKTIPVKLSNLIFPGICLLPTLSQQHSPSCSLWLLPIVVSAISPQCLNSLPHPYIICCASDSLYCGCLWVTRVPTGWLAGWTKRVREMLSVGGSFF